MVYLGLDILMMICKDVDNLLQILIYLPGDSIVMNFLFIKQTTRQVVSNYPIQPIQFLILAVPVESVGENAEIWALVIFEFALEGYFGYIT